MNYFGLSWGFQLFTGDPGFRTETRRAKMLNGKEVYIAGPEGSGVDPDKYREGIKYFGIGPFRFGRNGEWNRRNIQNKFAHDHKVIDFKTGRTVPYFKFLVDVPTKRYFYFGTGGGSGVY